MWHELFFLCWVSCRHVTSWYLKIFHLSVVWRCVILKIWFLCVLFVVGFPWLVETFIIKILSDSNLFQSLNDSRNKKERVFIFCILWTKLMFHISKDGMYWNECGVFWCDVRCKQDFLWLLSSDEENLNKDDAMCDCIRSHKLHVIQGRKLFSDKISNFTPSLACAYTNIHISF